MENMPISTYFILPCLAGAGVAPILTLLAPYGAVFGVRSVTLESVPSVRNRREVKFREEIFCKRGESPYISSAFFLFGAIYPTTYKARRSAGLEQCIIMLRRNLGAYFCLVVMCTVYAVIFSFGRLVTVITVSLKG
jgi:hypothetical protein